MSKKKSKKTKKHQPVKKKKSNKKAVIAYICVAVAAVLIIVGAIVADRLTNLKYVDFVGHSMYSTSAYDSKGKEVDLRDVYINADRYDNYRGSLVFNEDGTFGMWMGPAPNNGTNEGTFTYNRGENTIKAEYQNGDKIEFKIVRDKNGGIDHIEAPYEGYTIYFTLTGQR